MKKSHLNNLVLTILLGPVGLLYASAWQAVLLSIVAFALLGAGMLGWLAGVWALSIALGVSAVSSRNGAIDAQEAKEERRHRELVQAAQMGAAQR